MRTFLFFLVLSFLLVAPPADAQSRVVRGDGVFYCDPYVQCESAEQCSELQPHCEPLGSGDTVCTALSDARYELQCCENSEECGSRADVPGTCVEFSQEASGAANVGVCLYTSVFDLCLGDAETAEIGDVIGCFNLATDNVTSLAERYRTGDCDGDGVQNDVDPCPCSADDACLTAGDGGVPDKKVVDAGISGGGGCSASPSPTSWSLFGLVGMLILARRRRASRAR
jgi:uncharacterized protein (TIGR03382 family)